MRLTGSLPDPDGPGLRLKRAAEIVRLPLSRVETAWLEVAGNVYRVELARAARHRRAARRQSHLCAHGPGCFDRRRYRFRQAKTRGLYPACAHCVYVAGVEADHIIALAAGGLNCRDNFQPLCPTCHKTKTRRGE